mmetsp:Transcript_4579/g.10024  ORF Transcript_4579/g.10024 Transcript_4579/m.10024 type:complete len:554 (-) Transcript_4579:32-1693(-)
MDPYSRRPDPYSGVASSHYAEPGYSSLVEQQNARILELERKLAMHQRASQPAPAVGYGEPRRGPAVSLGGAADPYSVFDRDAYQPAPALRPSYPAARPAAMPLMRASSPRRAAATAYRPEPQAHHHAHAHYGQYERAQPAPRPPQHRGEPEPKRQRVEGFSKGSDKGRHGKGAPLAIQGKAGSKGARRSTKLENSGGQPFTVDDSPDGLAWNLRAGGCSLKAQDAVNTFLEDLQQNLDAVMEERAATGTADVTRILADTIDVAETWCGDDFLTELFRILEVAGVQPRVLKLYKCNMTDEGLQVVAEFCSRTERPVHELHLSHNQITSNGVITLCEKIRENPNYPRTVGTGADQIQPVPMWVRFERNHIENHQEVLDELESGGIPVCVVEDRKCSAGSCCQCKPSEADAEQVTLLENGKLFHFPYFDGQKGGKGASSEPKGKGKGKGQGQNKSQGKGKGGEGSKGGKGKSKGQSKGSEEPAEQPEANGAPVGEEVDPAQPRAKPRPKGKAGGQGKADGGKGKGRGGAPDDDAILKAIKAKGKGKKGGRKTEGSE